MITTTAVGFLAEHPAVTLVGQHQKCEFVVVSSRYHRGANVWERATFVAWDDEAERIATALEKGSEVSCTGVQETSKWTDNGGNTRYTTRYRLTYWVKQYRSASSQKGQAPVREERQEPYDRRPVQSQRPQGRANVRDQQRAPVVAPSYEDSGLEHGFDDGGYDQQPPHGERPDRTFL